jgi:dihydrolipoamide dehydrogenase
VANTYDLVVIGAGTGGYVAAIRAAQLGLKTAVVEKQKALGGTCLIWGCIPTKALLEHAHALEIARHAKEWGISFGGPVAGPDTGQVLMNAGQPTPGKVTFDLTPSVNMTQVQARKDKIVTGLTKGVEYLFKKNGISWIKGTARLRGGGRVTVSEGQDQELEAREIIVATGSAARTVPGVTLDGTRIITSDQAIKLGVVPRSIVILGSGAVGVEFASIFRTFGSDVTIIELLPRLVPNEDEAVSAELEKSFRKRGIVAHTGSRVTSARATASGVELDAELPGGKTQSFKADNQLVATGRGSVTTGLGVEDVGIALERGYVAVDELYRTNVPSISAIGDVIAIPGRPHPQLAHVSSMEGIITAERIAGREVRPINYDHVPGCTYTSPEIGSVGLTERQARERGYEVRIGTFPFGVLGRARISGETEGFVKIVADAKYDEILGEHMIGARSTELVAEAVLALRLECTVEELIRTIHAHPTMAEAVGEAAHATHGAAIHL